MAQPLIRAFAAEVLERLPRHDPVVEFGSLQVEPGQDGDLRPLFAGRPFVGTDIRPGPGVDRLEDLRQLNFQDREVGTALCLDTLEHCADPVAAGRELARVTHGVCLVSSVMLFGIHGYPQDFFRFTPEGMGEVLAGFAHRATLGVGDPDIPTWVVGIGSAAPLPDGFSLAALPSLRVAQERWERAEDGVRIGPLRVPPRDLARTLATELPRLVRTRIKGQTL